MDYSVPEVTSAEREFYGENLILLEGAISEFLSCMDMIRRYEVQLGNRDPVASFQTRIKSAESISPSSQWIPAAPARYAVESGGCRCSPR